LAAPFRLPRLWPYTLGALCVALGLFACSQWLRPVQASPSRPLPEVAEQAQYNVGLVDAQPNALGDSMSAAQSPEALGKTLMESKFDKAAEKLAAIDEPNLDHKEAKAVEDKDKMKQVAQEMGKVGLGQLGAAAGEMADGLKGGEAHFKKGARTLAKLVQGHSARRKIKEILDIEVSKLSECKGQCQSDKTARIRMPQKTESPSENWGAGISGNVLGAKTDRKSNREQKEITGNPGDGPSEVETTTRPKAADGRARISRALPEVPQVLRGRARQRADSPGPAPDHPPLLRADPPPEPRRPAGGSRPEPTLSE
jgi:hypothetical protein